MPTAYAWARPAVHPNVVADHTWVTDFDIEANNYATIENVLVDGANFWFCWGDFHGSGRTVGSQNFDHHWAACLVRPNTRCQVNSGAKGTVFTYGVDGVCHQLSNQVLYSTKIGDASPLTVYNARGYRLSSYIYGTYGLQTAALMAKVRECLGNRNTMASTKRTSQPTKLTRRLQGRLKAARKINAVDFVDDFAAHAGAVLADDPDLLMRLLSLRDEVQRYVANEIPGEAQPNAQMLNSRNQYLIDQAARLLGPEKFQAIFDSLAGQQVDLVDPSMIQE